MNTGGFSQGYGWPNIGLATLVLWLCICGPLHPHPHGPSWPVMGIPLPSTGLYGGPGSSIGKVLGYGPWWPRSRREGWRFFFIPSCPDWSWDRLSLLYNEYRGFLEVKMAEHRALPTAMAVNILTFASTSPHGPTWPVMRIPLLDYMKETSMSSHEKFVT